MNVVEEHQPNCLVTLHVEVPVDRVSHEWDAVVNEFRKYGSIPGYRKGSAPRTLIASRFAKEIKEELQRKLLNSSLEEAIKSKALNVVSVLGIENIELEKNRPLRFSAKVATAPVFELPHYTGIELEISPPIVSEEQRTQTLKELQKIYATYEPIEGRGLEMGDFAVVSYTTQLDGKPLEELVPRGPKRLFSGKNVWIHLAPDVLLPGFSEAILGMRPHETKSFELEVNQEYPVEELRGKKLTFDVVIDALNKEILPEWSDELAAKVSPGNTLEELKKLLFERLEAEAQRTFEAHKRQGVVDYLLSQVQTEVPNHLVLFEMKKVIREIVEENQMRGVAESQLRTQEDEIVGFAKKSAKDRVLATFLLLKIAEKENIQITEEDLVAKITAMSRQYNIAIPKLIKDLQRKNAIDSVKEQILLDKVLDFLVANVTLRQPAALPTI